MIGCSKGSTANLISLLGSSTVKLSRTGTFSKGTPIWVGILGSSIGDPVYCVGLMTGCKLAGIVDGVATVSVNIGIDY